MPFLAIDIGNTRLKWALYSAPTPGAGLVDHGAAFLEAIDDLAETAWPKLPAPSSMLGSCVAGEGDPPARRGAARDLGRGAALGRALGLAHAASPTATTIRTGSASTAGWR